MYYLTYASRFPSVIAYATSDNINGPWGYRGILNDYVENCETNHPSIIKYKWNWYFFYHNGALSTGGNWRRSVCVDLLYYNDDGTMKKIVQTSAGVPGFVAGTEEIGAGTDFQIKISPNPMDGNLLNIELSEEYYGRNIEISIHDPEGRLVYRDHIYKVRINGKTEIRFMDPLAPGSYIFICRSGHLFHSCLLLVPGGI
jgi:hypothetical protein